MKINNVISYNITDEVINMTVDLIKYKFQSSDL